MSNPRIDVLSSGAVRLGSNVVCDGFASGCDYRVQTHLHDDHMSDFDRSKGLQDLYLSPETYALLVAERNADLEYRTNLHPVPRGEPVKLDDDSTLLLLASQHMLGACQVALEFSDGYRVGYSGDFAWPLEEVIEVDQLVVDSTYGSPESVRHYTQDEAEQCLIELVCSRLRYGSVHVNAYRGTIERVLNLIGGNVGVPILASDKLIRQAQIYQNHGFAPESLIAIDSHDAKCAIADRSYVRLYSKGDGFGKELPEGTSVTISAYMADRRTPLVTYSDRAYKVALSNHADFNGVLDYVRATGAKYVVTDNTRNHGWQLALAISNHLGIHAEPSSNSTGPRWR